MMIQRLLSSLLLLYSFAWSGPAANAQVEEIAFEVETTAVTSSVFKVRVLVIGLPRKLWIAYLAFALRWPAEKLDLLAAGSDPSLGDRAGPSIFPGANAGEAVVSMRCDFGCGVSIIPDNRQPFCVLTFRTVQVIQQATIELLAELPEGSTFLFVEDSAVFPRLINGDVTFLSFLRGDSNQSGTVDLSDAVALLEYLFLGGDLVCEDFGDANDNGVLDISDAVYLFGYLFLGSPPPPPPLAEPGEDPTDDELSCQGFVP